MATLLRGLDEFRSCAHEPRPRQDLGRELVWLYREITNRNAQIPYEGTSVKNFDRDHQA